MRATGLAKAFAEFAALPALLRLQAFERSGVQEWARLLEEQGYSEDHLEPEDTPRRWQDLTAFVAKDAMRFCRRVRLLKKDGTLTRAGRRIAELADGDASADAERDDDSSEVLATVLAEQIRRHYRGPGGLELVELLHDAGAGLASGDHPWGGSIAGLLLAEADTLLWWGFRDAERARQLARELPDVRHRVLTAFDERNRRLDWEMEGELVTEWAPLGPVAFADAVAIWHYDQPELAKKSKLSLTELRVTTMAMVFAELLTEHFWRFQVSFFVPADDGS